MLIAKCLHFIVSGKGHKDKCLCTSISPTIDKKEVENI